MVVHSLVHPRLDGLAQQEAEVVPKVLRVPHLRRVHVRQLVHRHVHQHVVPHELPRLLRSQAKHDLLPFVHRIRRVVVVACPLADVAVTVPIRQPFHPRLLPVRLLHVRDQLLDRRVHPSQLVRRLHLIGMLLHQIVAPVHGRRHVHHLRHPPFHVKQRQRDQKGDNGYVDCGEHRKGGYYAL